MHLTLSFELNFFELLLQCWMVNLGCGFGGQDKSQGNRTPHAGDRISGCPFFELWEGYR